MLREDAGAVMAEMARLAHVYVLAHVVDDVGEATVRGALEAGGLVGPGSGQIPGQRVLFCSTLEGKVSVVRQLEPDLHIDGHPHTVRASGYATESTLEVTVDSRRAPPHSARPRFMPGEMITLVLADCHQ